MGTVSAILLIAVCLSATMMAAFFVAVGSGRSGWIDAIWSFAVGIFGAVAALLTFTGGEITPRQWLVAGLALAWSLRLGIHIAARTSGGGDDPRYSQLKQEWGVDFRSRLFWFLQIQAAAAFLLVLSIAAAAHNPAPIFGPGDWAGIVLMLVAVGGETLADRQLTAFRADPANKGKVCDAGLWGLSRHPNYFFEWLGWFAYAAIAIDLSGGYTWGWAALAGPILMYWLLVHVSGIPPLEAHMLRSRGERFRRYQARVNAFWPGPPRAAATAKGRRP
jgi:steroid 5-alpha reductase family enzyme